MNKAGIRSFFESEPSKMLHTVIGPHISFEGSLRFSGAGVVHIEGDFTGDIETTGSVSIGRNAKVFARLRAAHLMVDGKFVGDASTSDCVELRKNAVFEGNVKAPRMVIEPGALFQGEFQSVPVGNLQRALNSI